MNQTTLDRAPPDFAPDIYSDAALHDPYPGYRALRDLAPVVHMPAYGAYAAGRYADVREILRDWETFSSASGISLNEPSNMGSRGTTLASDPPLHDRLRGVIGKPLAPPNIKALSAGIEAEADALVERLVAKGRFDAAGELAQHLPITVISHLVGVPEQGRERMLDWAEAALNSVGPDNDRTRSAMPALMEMVHYALNEAVPEKLKPGSWAAQIFQAAERGDILREQCAALVIDFIAPSLDTTIAAVGNTIALFARHPEQWAALRENPALMNAAINEALRLESPVQGFSRLATRDCEVGGIALPRGARIVALNGSANRDERRWDDPERFDITRNAAEHLAFGYGVHACVGNPLARLEIRSLLAALAKRVARLEIADEKRRLNNVLRRYERLEVVAH